MKRLLVCLLLLGVVGCGESDQVTPEVHFVRKLDRKKVRQDGDLILDRAGELFEAYESREGRPGQVLRKEVWFVSPKSIQHKWGDVQLQLDVRMPHSIGNTFAYRFIWMNGWRGPYAACYRGSAPTPKQYVEYFEENDGEPPEHIESATIFFDDELSSILEDFGETDYWIYTEGP